MRCPNCGFDSPAEMKFCGMCGACLVQICTNCEFANPLAFVFCGQCGHPLAVSSVGAQRSELPADELSSDTQAIFAPRSSAESPAGLDDETRTQNLVTLEGEHRLATVIIADVKGSTNLFEQLGTEAWVALMNHVFQILEAEIYHYGGMVDQFRGDGLVAFFGTTLAHEDDPERAVLAALAMQRELKVFATELAEQKGVELLLRIGLNTGEVIVANIGEQSQHSEDTAMGEAIAIAARMESAAEPGTVLVSENTYHLVQSRFKWEALGEITAKGVSQPIAVYRPIEPLVGMQRSFHLRMQNLSSKLIGHDAQFEALQECVGSLYTSQGGIVMLTGSEGTGKTELVTALRERDQRNRAIVATAVDKKQILEMIPALSWLFGNCRSYEQTRPYALWLDLLHSWVDEDGSGYQSDLQDRLYAKTAALWGEQMQEYYPYLATILSLPLSDEFAARLKHLDGEGLQRQIRLALIKWLEAMSSQGPIVLVLDDVHWADTSTLELLEHCFELCERQPVLLIMVFRQDRAQPLHGLCDFVKDKYAHLLTRVELQPLTAEQSHELIDDLVGASTLPADMYALIVEKAQGNPFYIKELIHMLIRDSTLVWDEQSGRWITTQVVTSLDLPDTVRGLLLANMATLSPQQRHILQIASVIGPVFWLNVMAYLVQDRRMLEHHLAMLQESQFIQAGQQVPEFGQEYSFQSHMMRDAAYTSLLSTLRVTYHRQVAEYLEDFLGIETLPQYYNLLAYHYSSAQDSSKELFYRLRAAEQARTIYAADKEALRHYTKALELLEEMEAQTTDETRLYVIRTQRFEVLDGRRGVFFALGDFAAGAADASALLPLARQLDDDPAWLIDALLRQPIVKSWQDKDQLEEGISLTQQALELARQIGDRHRELLCLIAIVRQRLTVHDPDAEKTGEYALQLARELNDRQKEAQVLVGMGSIYVWSDQQERGVAYLEAALPLSRMLDDKITEMELLNLLSIRSERQGDYTRMLSEYHEKRLQIAREIGHLPLQASALMHCGQILGIYLGDHTQGLKLLREAEQFWKERPGGLFVLLRIVQVLTAQGQYEEAINTLACARSLEEQTTLDMGQAGFRLVAALLYNALGDRERAQKAVELAEEARLLVSTRQFLPRHYEMAADVASSTAHLRLAAHADDDTERQMHYERALAWSQAAYDLYQALQGVQIIECTSEQIMFCHSEALSANGQYEQAREYVERAYDETMRKLELIPAHSAFRQTFLNNIPLHLAIQKAYQAKVQSAPKP